MTDKPQAAQPKTTAEWAVAIENIFYEPESDGSELQRVAEMVAQIQEQAELQAMANLAGGIMKAARLG